LDDSSPLAFLDLVARLLGFLDAPVEPGMIDRTHPNKQSTFVLDFVNEERGRARGGSQREHPGAHVGSFDLCRVHVDPSGHPVRVGGVFYIRLNNGTNAIEDDLEIERYIHQRWGDS